MIRWNRLIKKENRDKFRAVLFVSGFRFYINALDSDYISSNESILISTIAVPLCAIA